MLCGKLLCVNGGRYLPGHIPRIEAVDQILQRDQQAFSRSIRLKAVVIVGYGDKPYPEERKYILQQIARFDVVTGKPGEILDDKRLDPSFLDFFDHLLELRTLHVCPCPAVVDKCPSKMQIRMLVDIFPADCHLFLDGRAAVILLAVFHGEPRIDRCLPLDDFRSSCAYRWLRFLQKRLSFPSSHL